MNDSATSVMATVPIANVSGAAGPAACTTRVILKAAVTVGETTARDRLMASGRFRRRISLAMDLRSAGVPERIQYVTTSSSEPPPHWTPNRRSIDMQQHGPQLPGACRALKERNAPPNTAPIRF